jgi:hypothetical protein
MSTLDFVTEPLITCPDTDANDVAFVGATSIIKGRNAVEEFLACSMHPLSAHFGFEEIAYRDPMFEAGGSIPRLPCCQGRRESDTQLLVKVELEADNIMGRYSHAAHVPASSRCPTVAT